MKKLIFIVLATIIIVGCGNQKASYDTSKSITLETIVIDGCEYIKGFNRLAHKGNCKFCQQRMRQMMWEVQDSILNTMD